MEASILIVSKNRQKELEYTLQILERYLDVSVHEVLVFLDGCTDGSALLINQFGWVQWYSSKKSIGASAARHQLYPKARGHFLIGLDDDAHPLHPDFIPKISNVFERNPTVGLVAFQEVKGIFNSDAEALGHGASIEEEYYTNEFIGCGFAIRRDVYNATNGFPVWVDIYGEESCVSIEVLAKGYDILYSNAIKVNHRVNKAVRKEGGYNYFRFGKQLKNTTYYYIVYYRFPLVKILKLYWHNFRKYALMDWKYCKIFFKTIFQVLIAIPELMKYRNPVGKKVINKMKSLSGVKF